VYQWSMKQHYSAAANDNTPKFAWGKPDSKPASG
jgi:hypothetical protein